MYSGSTYSNACTLLQRVHTHSELSPACSKHRKNCETSFVGRKVEIEVVQVVQVVVVVVVVVVVQVFEVVEVVEVGQVGLAWKALNPEQSVSQ